jgi:hypothetical protein
LNWISTPFSHVSFLPTPTPRPHNLNNANKQASQRRHAALFPLPPRERPMANPLIEDLPYTTVALLPRVLLLSLRPLYSFELSAVTNPIQNALYNLSSLRHCFSSHRMISLGGRGTSNIV